MTSGTRIAAAARAVTVLKTVGAVYLVNEGSISEQQERNAFMKSEIAKLDKEIDEIKKLKDEIAALEREKEELAVRIETLMAEHRGRTVPVPPHWGGYRVTPESVEFWQGRPSRLHDRLRYRLDGSTWVRERLAP